MNNKELYDFLFEWMTTVLGEDVIIIQGHQDSPAPKGNYLTLDCTGSWEPVGATPSHEIRDRDDLPSPRVFQYKGTVQIWESRGLGDNLILLAESLDDTEIKNLFSNYGVSVLKTNGPVASPVLNDSNWVREHLLTLTMLRARAKTGSLETIETVEVCGEISGTISKDKFETDITITNGG